MPLIDYLSTIISISKDLELEINSISKKVNFFKR